MPASRWGVFLLNNHAESKENWGKWVLFSLIPQRQSTVFFSSCLSSGGPWVLQGL